MISSLLALALLIPQDPGNEPPILPIGETLEAEITDTNLRVHTPTLDSQYTSAPVVAQTYVIDIEEPGAYTIELRSYLFDAYLVLRDQNGTILAEDDDGLIGSHARIAHDLEPGHGLVVEACALHGGRGPFEVRWFSGKTAPLTPSERLMAELEDLRCKVHAIEQAQGPEGRALPATLDRIGVHCRRLGNYEAARSSFERALAIREKILGPDHPATAANLSYIAQILIDQGDAPSAQAYFERALTIIEKALGAEHRETAKALGNLATALSARGDYSGARSHWERALCISEKTLGSEPTTVACLVGLSNALRNQGEFYAARPYLDRALAIVETVPIPQDLGTLQCLDSLAALLWAQGDYSGARSLFERALAIKTENLGPEHPSIAKALTSLATVVNSQHDYAEARVLLERALQIDERTLTSDHPNVAGVLTSLGAVLRSEGDYQGSLRLLERALSIRETALGPEHPDTSTTLHELGLLFQSTGNYARARPLLERALAIQEKKAGPGGTGVVPTLVAVGRMLQDLGDAAGARVLYERGLASLEATLGTHPGVATLLGNLGTVIQAQGDLAAARTSYERALAIREHAFGPDNPSTADALNNLALCLWQQGEHSRARALLERACAIWETVFGPEHPDSALGQNNLAAVLSSMGDDAGARRLYERALGTRERSLGPEHPDTQLARYNLATLLFDSESAAESRRLAVLNLESSVQHARKTLWSLSECERLNFLGQGECNHLLCLSTAISGSAGRAMEDAYDLSLAWRGLVSQSLLAARDQLRMSVSEEALAAMARLRAVQAEISKQIHTQDVTDVEAGESEIRSLREQRNAIEVELQRFAGPSTERAVSLEELRGALEPGSSFLDFLVHSRFEPARLDKETVVQPGGWTPDHLSAWIVRPDRELVHLDLGPADRIEEAVKRWSGDIVSRRGVSGGAEPEDSGNVVFRSLWQPLAEHLDGVARVFVRSDGFLGTVSFAVLQSESGRYLIEDASFVYVNTLLDVVQGEQPRETKSLLAVGGVDFRRRSELEKLVSAPLDASLLGHDLRGGLNQFWSKLPHTENEAQTVNDLFESVFPDGGRVLLSAEVPTEERLKEELPRHSIAHLATHGFFNPSDTISMWDSARSRLAPDKLRRLDEVTRGLVGQLPGLLTGLVCAGANEPAPPGRDDGLLTAEEVLWLDLSKVELVVLSACETALGERRAGEGMIGLRRAFGLAGAKTVVSSLWSVKDRSTSELMQRFYENLWLKKQGRAEALRNAQLEMLARNRATEHDALPSTWGAFVLSGEWR